MKFLVNFPRGVASAAPLWKILQTRTRGPPLSYFCHAPTNLAKCGDEIVCKSRIRPRLLLDISRSLLRILERSYSRISARDGIFAPKSRSVSDAKGRTGIRIIVGAPFHVRKRVFECQFEPSRNRINSADTGFAPFLFTKNRVISYQELWPEARRKQAQLREEKP